jgi:hypothetical protein
VYILSKYLQDLMADVKTANTGQFTWDKVFLILHLESVLAPSLNSLTGGVI